MMFNLALQHASLIAEKAVLLLMDVTVKSAALVAMAWLLCLALRRASAAQRHLVWRLTLGALLCVPLFSVLVPGREVLTVSEAIHVTQAAPPVSRPSTPALAPAPPQTATVNGAPAAASITTKGDPASAVDPAATSLPVDVGRRAASFVIGMLALYACGVWLLGGLLVLARTGIALLRLALLRRRLVPVTSARELAVAANVAREVGLRQPALLLGAADGSQVTVPLTWGASAPVVVLPPGAAQWSEERLRAALLHEVGHIRRGDWLAQMFAGFVCAAYWFHPLVWAASRAMRREAERAADDVALNHGLKASDYADHLLQIALALQERRQPVGAAMAMVVRTQSQMESRLRAILARNHSRQDVSARLRLQTIAAAVWLLLGASAFRFSTRAIGSPWITPPPAPDGPVISAVVDAPEAAAGATLPNGTTVRLIGVTDTQAHGSNRWWAADGAPARESLSQNTLVFPGLPPTALGRSFAFVMSYDPSVQPVARWSSAPNYRSTVLPVRRGDTTAYLDKPEPTWQILPDQQIQALGHFQEDEVNRGARFTELDRIPLALTSSVKTATVRYAVAAGPWTDEVTCKKTPGKVYVSTPAGQVIFTVIPNPHHLSDPNAVARGHAIVMVSDTLSFPNAAFGTVANRGYDRDILALDASGRVVYDLRAYPMQNDGRIQQMANIPNSALNRVAILRLRARPFEWVEFRNVQIQPNTS